MARGGKQQVAAAAKAYQRATRRLRAHLDEVDEGLVVFVEMMRQGESAAAVLTGTDASRRRRELADSFDDFEAAKKRLRLCVLRLSQEQGDSVADVARALGISRQLAYRLLAEGD